MIKLGITQLNKQPWKVRTFFRKELKNISITLYDQIINEPNADELVEKILLSFADERGAFKRTYRKRFEAFDNDILVLLQRCFDPEKPLLIQDMGVSDARTSVDFFEKVEKHYPKLSYYASDYDPKVMVLEKGKTKVTLSHNQKILEIVRPPFVFNIKKRDSYRHYPLNHFILFLIKFLIVPSMLRDYNNGKLKARELFLFSLKALKLKAEDQRFQLLQHDLLKPLDQQRHIIRAMNVLNHSYFSESEFHKIIANVEAALLPGGLFIVGSNQEAGSLVDGALYQKTTQGFRKIWSSGRGPEIESFILQPLRSYS